MSKRIAPCLSASRTATRYQDGRGAVKAAPSSTRRVVSSAMLRQGRLRASSCCGPRLRKERRTDGHAAAAGISASARPISPSGEAAVGWASPPIVLDAAHRSSRPHALERIRSGRCALHGRHGAQIRRRADVLHHSSGAARSIEATGADVIQGERRPRALMCTTAMRNDWRRTSVRSRPLLTCGRARASVSTAGARVADGGVQPPARRRGRPSPACAARVMVGNCAFAGTRPRVRATSTRTTKASLYKENTCRYERACRRGAPPTSTPEREEFARAHLTNPRIYIRPGQGERRRAPRRHDHGRPVRLTHVGAKTIGVSGTSAPSSASRPGPATARHPRPDPALVGANELDLVKTAQNRAKSMGLWRHLLTGPVGLTGDNPRIDVGSQMHYARSRALLVGSSVFRRSLQETAGRGEASSTSAGRQRGADPADGGRRREADA